MNLAPTEAQQMIVEAFARYLDDYTSIARVRSSAESGFDRALWRGLAKHGTFALRVPEDNGGLRLGLFDGILIAGQIGGAGINVCGRRSTATSWFRWRPKTSVMANGFIRSVDYGDGSTIPLVAVPWLFDGEPMTARRSPKLGADSDEVLAAVG